MINVRNLAVAGVIGLVLFATTSPLQARPKTEEQLIAALDSPKEKDVYNAMQDIEKNYPSSAKALTRIRKLLSDERPRVRSKAGRVLGAINADVDENDLKNIAKMLKASDRNEVIDALKSLRGLKAQITIPDIVPLLKSSDNNIKRDACRTLAVLGNKSLIPDIKPLLNEPDLAVQKDAADAIAILKEKE